MASKKNKLTQKIQEEVKKSVEEHSLNKIINDIQKKSEKDSEEISASQKNEFDSEKIQDNIKEPKKKETMNKRDSVYNVSADLRLEDYIEDKQKNNFDDIFKKIILILLVLLLLLGLWQLGVWLLAPKYYLSISTTEITEENYKSFLEETQFVLAPGQIIHIRFTWIKEVSHFFTIQIMKQEGGVWNLEATMGRKIPRTANYIYFAGPLDGGNYLVKVLDANNKLLLERQIQIIGQ